ncbi:MAG: Crp/Fnr family transcriptional regulator [Hyphomonadaceae bacterium]|nr:Crp/Fnr family transcriptional regulator [Hyphomonadaceae bacterium]
MAVIEATMPRRNVSCVECPLRAQGPFKQYANADIKFLDHLKKEHLSLTAGRDIIVAGDPRPPLYTLFSGWAFRFKMLSDGRRQILNFLLPGDPIGFQAHMFDAAPHSVQALTDVQLCGFHRGKIWDLYRHHPELAFDLTWLTAREEGVVDESLLSVGRRNALESVGALLIHLCKRAEALGLRRNGGVQFPLTQQHIADALGLSLVHTNKSMRKLSRLGLFEIKDGSLEMMNGRAVERLAQYFDEEPKLRPLL